MKEGRGVGTITTTPTARTVSSVRMIVVFAQLNFGLEWCGDIGVELWKEEPTTKEGGSGSWSVTTGGPNQWEWQRMRRARMGCTAALFVDFHHPYAAR